MSTIILTTGQPGAGKSYSRVRWLVKDFLLNSDGIYITNIPINVNLIAETMANKTSKPIEHFLNRLVIIDFDELKLWEQLQNENKDYLKNLSMEDFLPYVFFNKHNLQNCHIAIDEFHLYFNKNLNANLKKLWNDFFAEIRKLGCTFEAITQDSSLLPREFIGKVGTWVDLVPLKNLRDPFFHILLGDWYELRGAYFGIVEQKICQQEKIKVSSLSAVKWKITKEDKFVISSEFYQYYSSYQRNDTGLVSDVKTPSEIYGKKTIFWFLRRNFLTLFGKILLSIFVIWLCFFGGITYTITSFTGLLQNMAFSNNSNVNKKRNEVKKNVVPNEKIAQTSLSSPVSDTAVASADEEKTEIINNDDYKPAMFFNGFCWLRNGIKIYKDFQFNGGIYDKKTVLEINANERFYVLDDSTILFMY